jgi:hypothetical protein
MNANDEPPLSTRSYRTGPNQQYTSEVYTAHKPPARGKGQSYRVTTSSSGPKLIVLELALFGLIHSMP